MYIKIQNKLKDLSDEKCREISIKFIPNIKDKKILGVRIPKIRNLAKEIAKSNEWLDCIKNNKHEYIEETTLEGLIIGYSKIDEKEKIKYIKNFVEKIDNWATCDVVCSTLKFKDKKILWDFILPYSKEKNEYKIRFFTVMVITQFIEYEYIETILNIFNKIKTNDYYAQMGIAWALSLIYIKFPKIAMDYFKNCNLDNFIYNKSLQKIIESNRVNKETKDIIKQIKRKYINLKS